MYLKYLYLHYKRHYKFRSSTVKDKQSRVSLNIMSVHLSDFVGFVKILIRYRSKQCTSELSVMTTKMVSNTVFFSNFFFYFVCFITFTCLYFILYWLTQPTRLPEIQESLLTKRYRDTRATSMFLNVLMSMRLFRVSFSDHTPCSRVFIVDFEQVNTHCVYSDF